MEIVKVMGIDPGLRFTGYGIVNYNSETDEIWASNCGLIKTPQKIKGIDAILYMRDGLEEIKQKEFCQGCDHYVIEMPAAIYNKNFSSGALLPVACVAGCAFSKFDKDKIIPVYPSVWNESKRKEKTRLITEEILGDHTRWGYEEMPKAKPQLEHIVDAISMSLWYMRLNYLED